MNLKIFEEKRFQRGRDHPSYVERLFCFSRISLKLFQMSKTFTHKSFTIKMPLFNHVDKIIFSKIFEIFF